MQNKMKFDNDFFGLVFLVTGSLILINECLIKIYVETISIDLISSILEENGQNTK